MSEKTAPPLQFRRGCGLIQRKKVLSGKRSVPFRQVNHKEWPHEWAKLGGHFLLKNYGMSVILKIWECCPHTAGGLAALWHGVREPALLHPWRFTAKGGMDHDAFGDFSSTDADCNGRLWNVRHRLENLRQQKMTAPSLANWAVIFVTSQRAKTVCRATLSFCIYSITR